jgi:hypothetical protein
MKAFQVLAAAANDTTNLPEQARASAQNVTEAMSWLWASEYGGFWRVWQDGSGGGPIAPMSGTLHGQSWATALGLGSLLPEAQVRGRVAAVTPVAQVRRNVA